MLRALSGMLILLAASCSAPVYVQASVQCYGLGPEAAANLRAFTLAPAADAENPLRDRAIGQLVVAALSARGLEHRGDRPAAGADEFHVSVRSTVAEAAQYVPPETRIYSAYRPGRVWRYQVVGSDGATHWVTVREPGDWHPESWTRGGYTERVFTHRLALSFSDADGRELWRAEVSAMSASGDTMAIMRACVPMALDEYPVATELPVDRLFRLNDPPQ